MMYSFSFVVSHLYISAAVIVIIFGGSLYWKLKWRYEEYKRFGREERMEDDIVFIKAQLQEIKEQQKEMLNLLKELKSANIDRPVNFVLFSQHHSDMDSFNSTFDIIRILHLHALTQLQEIKEHQEETLNPLKVLKSVVDIHVSL